MDMRKPTTPSAARHERTAGKEMLARDLLFKTEIDDGEELIQQPRPDHAVGYITQQDAHSMNPRPKAVLERTEEVEIARHALTTQLRFPFLMRR